MPWINITPMEEIIRFVMLARSGHFTVTELCEQFGISRKTGYKYLERHSAEGLKGLQLRSHRPHLSPQRTAAAIEALILSERHLHQTWGPKKLHKVLEVKHGIESPPARSTIGEILRRHGVSARRRRKPASALLSGLRLPGGIYNHTTSNTPSSPASVSSRNRKVISPHKTYNSYKSHSGRPRNLAP